MLKILPLNKKVKKQVQKYDLENKFKKQISFLKSNPTHPSLNVELLEPKQHGIYSFRIDRKYRALFIYRPDEEAIEILSVTIHYR
ncbi:type II toxin-antitoxin system YoeB family toxin [Patescibacteria group bacterium]|nr:type II toxin-antitoxin system YoeB family toxin [Patescibacteria group bacterium]